MQVRLVESVLVDLPIPPLWIAGSLLSGDIVDGLQRLTALTSFREGHLELGHLQRSELTHLEGKRWGGLTLEEQIRFESYPMSYFSLDARVHGSGIGREMFDILNLSAPLTNIERTDGQFLGTGRQLIHDLANEVGALVPHLRWRNISRRGLNYSYVIAALVGLFGEYREYTNPGVSEWGFWGSPMRAGGNDPRAFARVRTYETLNGMSPAALEQVRLKFHDALRCLSSVLDSDELLSRIGSSRRSPRFNNTLSVLQFALVSTVNQSPDWWAAHREELRKVLLEVQTNGRLLPDRLSLERCFEAMRSAMREQGILQSRRSELTS